MGLRLKIFLFLTLVFCVAGALLGKWLLNNIPNQFLRLMEDGMVDQAFLLSKQMERQLPDKDPFANIQNHPLNDVIRQVTHTRLQAKIYDRIKETVPIRVYLIDKKGKVRFDSYNHKEVGKDYSQWRDVVLALRGQYGARSSWENQPTFFSSFSKKNKQNKQVKSLFVSFPLHKNNQIIGVLTLSKDKESLKAWIHIAYKKVLVLVVGVFLWLYFCSILFTQWVLKPIFKLTQYAKAVSEDQRISPPPIEDNEIGRLTQAFVEMKENLWKRQDIEPFITQLTHELKSPVTAIQGASELLEDEEMPADKRKRFLTNIQEQSQRINEIIHRMLNLVHLEEQEFLTETQEISVTALLKEMKQRFLPIATQQEIRFHLDDPSASLFLKGDLFLLQQAFSNIIQNSFHFTPVLGEIRLKIFSTPTTIVFQITDTGPGIPEYAKERVLDKFYSLEHPKTGKKGTGLGLPFVKEIVLLHKGSLKLFNREKEGLTVEIELPLHKKDSTTSIE